ncbi:DNA-damage-inducible protein J [Methylobacterium phyllostachyos]|uniref:DNA-damage-inducible protein J n=1 Tax=Methylobacterium phyllostachyos TaxID=582672 RepID=A0A1G9UZ55_9HYPH|nr:type II toxin-antitoxin system RelB/DinJ family antitoxin [Methylobacterium phyllostachyos]SDM65057.1 DNA-damage-inducible protein J [Methylobacterium phyllostachyos]
MANVASETDVDPVTQEEAAAVLAGLGFTVSDAVRLLLTRVAREKA